MLSGTDRRAVPQEPAEGQEQDKGQANERHAYTSGLLSIREDLHKHGPHERLFI